jgi:hypothetical protein
MIFRAAELNVDSAIWLRECDSALQWLVVSARWSFRPMLRNILSPVLWVLEFPKYLPQNAEPDLRILHWELEAIH